LTLRTGTNGDVRAESRWRSDDDELRAPRAAIRLWALEPHYEALLLELHHDKHHAAYVNGANDHQGNIGNGTVPLLVLDMWEHAYYLQYQYVKGDWVKAFWKIVNWEDVAGRFRSVGTLDLAL
jgi:superoxide dismutase